MTYSAPETGAPMPNIPRSECTSAASDVRGPVPHEGHRSAQAAFSMKGRLGRPMWLLIVGLASCGAPVPSASPEAGAPTCVVGATRPCSCTSNGNPSTGTDTCSRDRGFAYWDGCRCECVPNCASNLPCGADGCGGSCGTCDVGSACDHRPPLPPNYGGTCIPSSACDGACCGSSPAQECCRVVTGPGGAGVACGQAANGPVRAGPHCIGLFETYVFPGRACQ
jgi:hypothetical protein